MKKTARIISFITAAVLIFALASGVFSASAFYNGQWIGIGTVRSSSSSTITSGLTYSLATLTDSSSNGQRIRSLTFNPATSNVMPLIYSQFTGYGATLPTSANGAESKYGYDVKAGVNASFFSMATGCNTYGGTVISDGKVIQGCYWNDVNYELIFNSDGTSALVQSRVSYVVSSPWNVPLDNINIYPETTDTGLYYFDTSCGTSSDIRAAGVEVVFNKIDSELTVGGTLVGEVCAIRSNATSGGAIGINQFTLYACNSSPYVSYLRALTVGSKIKIDCQETVAASKQAMENCNSAVVTYGYIIVQNGQNVTGNDGLGYSFNVARAQRTAVGIKADGTIIILTCDGRTNSYPGLTVYQLADTLIAMGCVTAVDLDGGGSTQMMIESGGSLTSVQSSSRRVANCLLVVTRPAISYELRNTLANAITAAQNKFDYCYLSNWQYLNDALYYARTVYNSNKSMPGDYKKAIMRINAGLESVVVTGYKPMTYRFGSGATLRASASDSASWLASIPAGTTLAVTQVSGDFGYTKYMSNTGWVRINNATVVGPISYDKTTFTCAEERYALSPYTASWTAVTGASGYTYKVIQLAGEPDPGNSNESAGGKVLVEGTGTRDLGVMIPASAMTAGKYLKIGVAVDYPDKQIWNFMYVRGSELPFTDIPMNHWAYEAVKHVYTRGYFSGTAQNTFSPNMTMTRGMLAVVMYRMAGSPAVSGENPFSDVASTAYYYNAVIWCSSNGIVNGYPDGTYLPNANITREQAAVLLYRYAQFRGYDVSVSGSDPLSGFSDASSVSSWAAAAMRWAVKKGIINGTGNNMLNPQGEALRSHVAMIIKNFDTIYQSSANSIAAPRSAKTVKKITSLKKLLKTA
ncbi:MAG: S-layer homology domain-containing protein [Clostridia bacterium]|nr:S-layer homology domain-containing protein [Clostridia bacterium]